MPVVARRPVGAHLAALAATAIAVGGCSLREAPGTPPRPAHAATTTGAAVAGATDSAYVLAARSFHLVATSRAALTGAKPALEATARGFEERFGATPPNIAVVVIDTATRVALRLLADPPAGLPTLTLVGPGLAETARARALARESLGSEVRLGAAQAWVGAYTDAWAGQLRVVAVADTLSAAEDSRPATRLLDRRLPDWLEVAVLHVLADTTAEERATRDMRRQIAGAMPLASLFRYRVAESDSALHELLRAPGPSSETAAADDGGALRRDETALFVAQATSLLQYLETRESPEVARRLLPPLLAGHDMREILAELRTPSTPEALEADWHHWLTGDGVERLTPRPAAGH